MRIETFTIAAASHILRVELPTTMNALKSAFRRRSREVHPDHSVAVDATKQFQALSAAYEFAQTQPAWLLETEGEEVNGNLLCDDGTPLADLGKGLGPLKNGRPCDGCGSKGFTSYSVARTPCVDCRVAFGRVSYRCRRCGGDGVFKRNGRSVGECNGCRGEGWIAETKRVRDPFGFGFGVRLVNRCVTCKGERDVPNPQGRQTHVKCYHCKGTGELLVFNPVIPKGLLGSRR